MAGVAHRVLVMNETPEQGHVVRTGVVSRVFDEDYPFS